MQLTELLGVRVTPQQVVQSHTPMRGLAKQLGDQPVLVAGRGLVADVARSYGFHSVLT